MRAYLVDIPQTPGEFWERLVKQLRGDNADGYTVYDSKEEFMHTVMKWYDEPDIGYASIAWDLVSMERGEDGL